MKRESSSLYMPLLFPKFSSKGIHKTNEDRNFDHAEVEFDTDKNSRRYFDNKPKKKPIRARGPLLFLLQTWGGFDQQKQICVTGSMCGTKFQRNECITSPGKQGQNYFAMSRLFKTRIALYMGLKTGV